MVANDKSKIGLNEVKFAPITASWIRDSFTAIVGQRESENALLNGKLYSVSEA